MGVEVLIKGLHAQILKYNVLGQSKEIYKPATQHEDF